jgi:hypothetical protein
MSVKILKNAQQNPARLAPEDTPPPAPRRFVDGETRLYPVHSRRPISRFGEWLVRRGLISRADLFSALSAAHRHRCRLGDALVWLEVLDRGELEAEARRFGSFANASTTGNIVAR